MTTLESRGTVQVIARAAKMLRLLAQTQDGLTQTEISRKLELPRSTVHRILRALHREGLVDSRDGSRYLLGSTFANPSSNRQQTVAIMHPRLVQIAQDLAETAQLAVLEHDHSVLIDQVVSNYDLRVESSLGATRPLHCTAKGKAILSLLPNEVILALLPAELSQHTPHTVTSSIELLEQLDEVRKKQFAWSREEWSLGICSISIPLAALSVGPASLSVLAPSQRVNGNEGRFERGLLEQARQIHSSFAPID